MVSTDYQVTGVVDIAQFRAQQNVQAAAVVRLSRADSENPLNVLVSLDNTATLLARNDIPNWLFDAVIEMQENVDTAHREGREYKIDGAGLKQFTQMVEVIAHAIFIKPSFKLMADIPAGTLPTDALCIRDLDDYAQSAVLRLFNGGVESLKRYHQKSGASDRTDSAAVRPETEPDSVSGRASVDESAIRLGDQFSFEFDGRSEVSGAVADSTIERAGGSEPESEQTERPRAIYPHSSSA